MPLLTFRTQWTTTELNMQAQTPAGYGRFIKQLGNLSPHLIAASQSLTPALTLFRSPARQYAFYLEALARIYRKIHDKAEFNKLRKAFKLLEDQLGRIDFYNDFWETFSKMETMPPQVVAYFRTQTVQELDRLQQLLEEKEWLDAESGMVTRLTKMLAEMHWLPAEEDTVAIQVFLNESWEDFKTDFKKGRFDFTLLELGVHEFRRQLRWFSIYAQALDGLIQLKDDAIRTEALQEYLTPEILNSPFNKMPAPENSLKPVLVAAPDFYAASWVISEIGKLKDVGLRFHSLTKAIIKTNLKNKDEAAGYAAALLNETPDTLKQVESKAKEMANALMEKMKLHYDR